MSRQDVQRLVRELQVQQIELELQNQELGRFQHELIDSRDRMIELFEHAPVAYLTTDLEGSIRDANPMAGALLGIACGELPGRQLREFVRTEQHEELARYLGALPASCGEKQVHALGMRSLSGAGLEVQMEGLARPDRDGLHLALVDMTAQRLAERELRELNDTLEKRAAERAADAERRAEALAASEARLRVSESRLRAILEASPDAVLTLDEGGVVQSCNPAAESMFDRDAAEIEGSHVCALTPARDRAAVRAHFLHDGPCELVGGWHEARGRRRDGSTFPVECSVSALHLDGEHLYSCIVRDLSDKKRMESELRHTQKMDAIGRLASGLAHDFNNLLMGIIGCTDMCLHAMRRDDPIRSLLERQRDAAVNGSQMVRQLMDFSRRDEDEASAALDEAILRASKILQKTLGDDIDFRLSLRCPEARVPCGQARLDQILMNLAINARQAMPAGGELEVATEVLMVEEEDPTYAGLAPGDYVRLTIRDSGIGMDELTRLRAFEPFFTTKPVGEGTGLGLSTVYGIVTKAGGHLLLSSEPGVGTEITAIFPVVSKIAEKRAVSRALPKRRGNGGTVLVVEDDELVREAVHHYLTAAGFSVVEACDGEDALGLCAALSCPVDLVVTDMALPQMSGETLARELGRRCPDTPVLFVSAHSTEDLRRRGRLPAGACSLQKPFDAQALISEVNRVLGATVQAPH